LLQTAQQHKQFARVVQAFKATQSDSK